MLEIDELIDKSNIPNELKNITKAICKGYIRESKNKISIDGIKNICNTKFKKIEENIDEFRTENMIYATTSTDYDENCNIFHELKYIDEGYIKLISILTHEIGHVITETKPCQILNNGYYPLVKRTTSFYYNCRYEMDSLITDKILGFRLTDGFLESMCTKIFESKEFRSELLSYGYDLKDYIYKDERLFDSRIYDDYKACFELFDYIMDGKLFDFSCKTFKDNKEFVDFINTNKLETIFKIIDKSNEALFRLKEFEGQDCCDFFCHLLEDYLDKKHEVINLAYVYCDLYNKSVGDSNFINLLNIYIGTINKHKLLPIPKNYIEDNQKKLIF